MEGDTITRSEFEKELNENIDGSKGGARDARPL